MATWAKGFDFKNSENTTRIGGIGTYGTDTAVEKIYIGLGSEPWNNAGLQVTSSAINFKGNKIYHAGDKPTPADIGAATSSHTHNYAGSSSAGGNANAAVKLATARTLTIGSTGKTFDGSGNVSWSLSEIGAAAASHTHSYLPLSGGTISGSSFGPLTIKRSGSTNAAAIYFSNDNGTLGAIGMSASKNGGLIRWSDDTASSYTILDTGNYKTTITPANIGAATSSHTHNYAGSSSAGGAATSALACTGNSATATTLATARTLTVGNTGKSFNGSANVSWSLSEIGAAAASHTHTTVGSYMGISNTTGTNGYGLSLYGGATAGAPSYGIMFQQTGTFGTHGSVTSDWATYFTMAGSTSRGWIFKAGNSSGGNVASISATGVVTAVSFVGSLSGNASTASSAATLTTARTINGTSFNGSANITTANWGTARTITIGSTGKSVNGSANVSWSLSEIGAAAASHTHSYLPLSGGTLTGRLTSNGKISIPTTGSSWITGKTLANASIAISTAQTTSAYHPVLAVQSSSGHVANLGGLGDAFGFYGYKSTRTENGTDWGFTFNVGTGAVSSTGSITAPSFIGNASTATTLQTARTINGTSFNGSANITTANWGTARTITIGNTGKSVNGSGNVSWSLSEIGAAASSHTHNYAGSASAGGAANSATVLATARTINGTSFNGSANITTANWGTARTITIGNTAKSVNGSGNVSWSLPEIGLAKASASGARYGVTPQVGADGVMEVGKYIDFHGSSGSTADYQTRLSSISAAEFNLTCDNLTFANNDNWKSIDFTRYGCRSRYGIGSDGTGGTLNFPAIEMWVSGASSYTTRFEVKSDRLRYIKNMTGTPAFNVWVDTGSHGGISIGSSSSAYLKWLRGSAQVQVRNYADSAYASIAASAFTVNSKQIFKENIVDLESSKAINIVMNNDIKLYNLVSEREELQKINEEAEELGIILDDEMLVPDIKAGLILDDLTPEAEELLHPERTEGVDIYSMISVVWKVCQEQQKNIDELKQRIQELENK